MNKKDVYELTNPQKLIWSTEIFCGDTTVNNICVSGTILEEVNINLLKRAINSVVEQNDAFRIQISTDNNKVTQYISEFKPFNIDVQDIENANEIKLIEKEEVKYRFDILNSCLFKFKILTNKNSTTIILTAHHIISDSWSMGLVIKEILRNYNNLKDNKEEPLQTFSFEESINSEREYKLSKKYEDDKKYWLDIFSSIPDTAEIPSINPPKSNNNPYAAKRASFNINKNLVTQITDFCKSKKISVFNFFMSALSIYIGRVSNLNDFVIRYTNFKQNQF